MLVRPGRIMRLQLFVSVSLLTVPSGDNFVLSPIIRTGVGGMSEDRGLRTAKGAFEMFLLEVKRSPQSKSFPFPEERS